MKAAVAGRLIGWSVEEAQDRISSSQMRRGGTTPPTWNDPRSRSASGSRTASARRSSTG